jgi:hypothetical protein
MECQESMQAKQFGTLQFMVHLKARILTGMRMFSKKGEHLDLSQNSFTI